MKKTCSTEIKQPKNESQPTGEHLIGAQRLLLTGYWEWNLKTKQYIWCPEMHRIFNLRPESCPVRTGTFFNCVHPEDRGKVVRALGKALVGEQPFNMEHRIVSPDGSVRIVLGKAEVTFDEGRPVRVLGTVQEINDKPQVKKR